MTSIYRTLAITAACLCCCIWGGANNQTALQAEPEEKKEAKDPGWRFIWYVIK